MKILIAIALGVFALGLLWIAARGLRPPPPP
jgi:hypothetical protein